jgi:hypothetical protein
MSRLLVQAKTIYVQIILSTTPLNKSFKHVCFTWARLTAFSEVRFP